MEKREGKKRHYSGKLGEFSYANTQSRQKHQQQEQQLSACVCPMQTGAELRNGQQEISREFIMKNVGGEKMKSNTHKNE
jgi:hypothetical protein